MPSRQECRRKQQACKLTSGKPAHWLLPISSMESDKSVIGWGKKEVRETKRPGQKPILFECIAVTLDHCLTTSVCLNFLRDKMRLL